MISLPKSLEAEQNVLGCALLSQEDALLMLEKCDVDDFFYEDHKKIFLEIKRQVDEYGNVDVDICVERIVPTLHKKTSFSDVINHSLAFDIDSRISELKKYTKLRTMLKVSLEIQNRVKDKDEPDNIIADVEKIVFSLTSDDKNNLARIDDYNSFVEDNYWMFKETQYRTGIYEIDKKIMLHDGLMYILAGAPGQGKTSFATYFLLQLSKHENIPVLLFSQEVSGSMINFRLGHSLGKGNNIDAYKTGNKQLENIPFYIDDTPSLGYYQLRSKVMRYKKRLGIKMFVLDYLQLTNGYGETQNIRVANMSKGIVAMARETETCFLVLSQLTKEGIKKREPSIADLRDSGQIAQDAKGVYFIYENPDYENSVVFKCAKQNFGKANWHVDLYFNKEENIFGALDKTHQEVRIEW